MKIMFTGGGTAGHIIPNLSLIEALCAQDKQTGISYIGSKTGLEKQLVEEMNVPYYGVSNGKLRRYFSWQNFVDPFKVIGGIFQSLRILRKEKPNVLFSKGGFVAVPPTIAAFLKGIPVIVHESDMTPGLANKISFPFAKYICTTFESTMAHLPEKKAVHTGAFVRPSLFQGSREKAFEYLPNFSEETITSLRAKNVASTSLKNNERVKAEKGNVKTFTKKVILVMGGSLGSVRLNSAVKKALPELLKQYAIIHLCGKGNLDVTYDDNLSTNLDMVPDYQQIEYASENLRDLLALSDLVVSRAGATAIFEFLALQKPMLLIPLTREVSRGDQILNAEEFVKREYANILYEENITDETFLSAILNLDNNSKYLRERQAEVNTSGAVEKTLELFELLIQK